MFEKFDKDKSGALDANEFAALAFSLGGNFTKEEIDAAMAQLDTGAYRICNRCVVLVPDDCCRRRWRHCRL